MKTLTPRQIGEKFNKDAKFINEIFMDLDFISRDKNGFKLAKKGENFGGEQKNYMGKFYVAWDEKILSNKLFLKLINSDEAPEQNSDENDFRKKFEAQYRTKSGYFVRSRAEVIIADWLFNELVVFAYEKRVPIMDEMYCDFYLPCGKIYIEFWGLENDKKYVERKIKKQRLYAENGLNLIQIDDKILENLDDFLPKELLKFGINLV